MDNLSKTFGKLTIPLLVLLTISFSALPAQAKYGGGTGEPNDPYLIYTAEQMNAIGANPGDWDKHFLLMADIDLSGFTATSFNIIGYWVDLDSPDNKPFTGVFDGSGHTISNFTYDSNGVNYIGLFGYVYDPNAEIKDLGLIDPNVDAGTGNNVGSLVSWLWEGTIANCYAEGGNVSGYRYVGGLVGYNVSGTIRNCYATSSVEGMKSVGGLVGSNSGATTNCYSTGSVTGDGYIGGLVGRNYHGTITNCYATGTVSGSGVGGLVGCNRYGTITNCYSEASVSGYDLVGGLVGWNDYGTITNSYVNGSVSGRDRIGGLVGYNERSTITNCYSAASVSGDEEVGGLVGENEFGTITNCYATASVTGTTAVGGLVGYNERGLIFGSFWDTQTSGQSASDGGMPKTTPEMQTASTFVYWGCDPVWTIDEGNDYPRLWWENIPGDVITNPSYCQGSGEPNDPYLIDTAEQFNTIGLIPCDWDKHFLLCADIDLSGFTGTDFNIIGNFTGVLDGNGHTISNLTYKSTDTNYIGLFGWIDDPNAEIKNLGLIDPNLDAGLGDYVGSLVGHLENGTISNCYVQGGNVAGYGSVGGLVGDNYSGTITNCYSAASVSGDYYVGGLVGLNERGTITNCYVTASVSGNVNVGGLAGYNEHGTITNCYSTGSILGDEKVGGLVGENYHPITNCYSEASVSGYWLVGGLVGHNEGSIIKCYATGSVMGDSGIGGLVGANGKHSGITNCYATGSVTGTTAVGGLAGSNSVYGTITNCCSTGSVSGDERVGGLVGSNGSTITNCYSSASVAGTTDVGGLVGTNWYIISNCYSIGSVTGTTDVGGLVGSNAGTITNSCSKGDVSGGYSVGGLVGVNSWCEDGYCSRGTISNCYSTGTVLGDEFVGGLAGGYEEGEVTGSFWDIETSGYSTSVGGTGLPTAEMQTESTFTDAGWDFTTPIWTIDEGVDYPRLWWELALVLHAEPEVTLGTSNTISWDPVVGAIEYYAECTADANFTSIVYNTGWITETSCEFTGLEVGKRYWYSVKARNLADIETDWSNVESSLQGTLADAVDMMLDPNTLKNKNLKTTLLNKIYAVQQMIDEGLYEAALNKLQNDILQKTDGCAKTGRPDKNDWIITCEGQSMVYPLIIEAIEYVRGLME